MEIKRTKGTSELRKALNEKMQDVFSFEKIIKSKHL